MANSNILYKHNWNAPTSCPICGGALELSENHTRLFCTNETCRSKLSGRIVRFAALMDWYGFGPVVANDLVDKCDCKKLGDIFTNYKSLLKLDGYGESSVGKLEKYLKSKPETTMAHFLGAFGIRGFGEKTIEKIIDAASTINEVLAIEPHDAKGIRGNRMAEFLNALKNEYAEDVRTVAQYVTLSKPKAVEMSSNKLEGLTFCFTGKAEAIEGGRKRCEALVVENGGKVSSVKAGLSYLVTDDTESGSSKNVAAKKLGIPVITSFQFKDMIGC